MLVCRVLFSDIVIQMPKMFICRGVMLATFLAVYVFVFVSHIQTKKYPLVFPMVSIQIIASWFHNILKTFFKAWTLNVVQSAASFNYAIKVSDWADVCSLMRFIIIIVI